MTRRIWLYTSRVRKDKIAIVGTVPGPNNRARGYRKPRRFQQLPDRITKMSDQAAHKGYGLFTTRTPRAQSSDLQERFTLTNFLTSCSLCLCGAIFLLPQRLDCVYPGRT